MSKTFLSGLIQIYKPSFVVRNCIICFKFIIASTFWRSIEINEWWGKLIVRGSTAAKFLLLSDTERWFITKFFVSFLCRVLFLKWINYSSFLFQVLFHLTWLLYLYFSVLSRDDLIMCLFLMDALLIADSWMLFDTAMLNLLYLNTCTKFCVKNFIL
jgi:hypothetical protein